jgi:hypothetical protein
MVSSMGKKECLLSNILASAFREHSNKKGKGVYWVCCCCFLEGLVGLGDAIAFIFRVKLQGRMFGDFWAFFRQLNL